jgi:hypothetical protein
VSSLKIKHGPRTLSLLLALQGEKERRSREARRSGGMEERRREEERK